MRTLVVIPARGGSKGIPRKNLRPLGGKPLLAWTIEMALKARVDTVLVSTDSEEIAAIARRFGADAMMRDPGLAKDTIPLDPVIYEALIHAESGADPFDLVVTVQPTSPLLQVETLNRILTRLEESPKIDTILTVVDDTHLAWVWKDGKIKPDYTVRLNRQELPERFKETGGVMATRRHHVTDTGRIGPAVSVEIVNPIEGIDIDGPDEWLFTEAALGRRRVAFIVIGNRRQGMGHVTRVRTLMESMSGHIVKAFCTPEQDLAIQSLESSFFPYEVVEKKDLMDALKTFGAQIVIHDELETSPDDLRQEREAGMKIVCFEDRGVGMESADLVFDALYPKDDSKPEAGRVFGSAAYILRDEFRFAPRDRGRNAAERVLITFGGTDPSCLTEKVLGAIGAACPISITVVAGKGFDDFERLETQCNTLRSNGVDIELHRDVALMSDVMSTADIAFSSSGRTLYELAYLRIPTIVLAQNDLELKHTFASAENGFLFLGLGSAVSDKAIQSAFQTLLTSQPLRDSLSERMGALDLESGRKRVVRTILEL